MGYSGNFREPSVAMVNAMIILRVFASEYASISSTALVKSVASLCFVCLSFWECLFLSFFLLEAKQNLECKGVDKYVFYVLSYSILSYIDVCSQVFLCVSSSLVS